MDTFLTLEPVAVDEKALNGFVGRECPAVGFRAAVGYRGAVKAKGHGVKPSPPQTAGWAFAPYNHVVSLCMAPVSRCARNVCMAAFVIDSVCAVFLE